MAVERLTSWGYVAEGVLIFLLAEYERDILSSLDKYVRGKNYYILLLDGNLMLLLFLCNSEPPTSFFFFFTLVAGPRRSLSLKLSDTRAHAPQIRARLGNTAHLCKVVVLKLRAVDGGGVS